MEELKRIRTEFVQRVSMSVHNGLLDDLLQREVLSTENKDYVLEKYPITTDRARCLIDLVTKKGERASQMMLDSLKVRDRELYLPLEVSPTAKQQHRSSELLLSPEEFKTEKLDTDNIIKDGDRIATRRSRKSTQKIELRWMHERKQLRQRSGGGTRVFDISSDSTKKDLISHAKDLYFPGGESKKGKWEDFTHNILDFKESELNESTTVSELSTVSKITVLQFYLSTASLVDKSDIEVHGENDSHDDTIGEQQRQAAVSQTADCNHKSSSARSAVVGRTDLTSQSSDLEVIIGDLTAVSLTSQLDDTVAAFHYTEDTLSEIQLDDDDNDSLPVPLPIFAPSTSTRVDHAVPGPSRSTLVPGPSTSTPVPGPSTPLPEGLLYERIKLHRANLLEEMIRQFKDEAILSYTLKYSFVNEKGADADGVARDVYAAFWTEFLDCAAEGAEMRVPALSPKWQDEEWKAVGRILAKGFVDQGYFPLRLAPAFTTALLFGEHAASPDVLFESLLFYLSHSERDLITTALQEDLDSDSQEELLDLLDRLGVKMIPSRDNLKAILLQVAHKQIIQQPKYALDNMSAAARLPLMTSITTTEKLQVMYEDKKPTCTKILTMIESSPVTPSEKRALRFLQQYILELDEKELRRMLRFVTGSD